MRWLLSVLLLAALPATAGDSAHMNYVLRCQGCHTPDGRGAAGKVPDLRDTLPRLLAAAGGREFVVQVPGAAYSPLNDAELAAVLNWMARNIATLGPDFQPYSGAEVGAARRHHLADVSVVRHSLLTGAPPR